MMGQSMQKGFTLPELLLSGLAATVLIFLAVVVIRPTDYSPQSRNAERWVAVALQMEVLTKHVSETGDLPPGITEKPQLIGSEKGMVDLCLPLTWSYPEKLLYDPILGTIVNGATCKQSDAAYATGLTVVQKPDKSVTIIAPAAENGEEINLTKKF